MAAKHCLSAQCIVVDIVPLKKLSTQAKHQEKIFVQVEKAPPPLSLFY
jgi:hypothetical protein